MVVISGNDFADVGTDVASTDFAFDQDGDGPSDLFDDIERLTDTDPSDEHFPEVDESAPATGLDDLEAGYFGEDPADAAQVWHMQESSHSCAVAAQEFVLNDITGEHYSEAELCAIAEENGWYTPGQGPAPEDIGKILNTFGVPTERHDRLGGVLDGARTTASPTATGTGISWTWNRRTGRGPQ